MKLNVHFPTNLPGHIAGYINPITHDEKDWTVGIRRRPWHKDIRKYANLKDDKCIWNFSLFEESL